MVSNTQIGDKLKERNLNKYAKKYNKWRSFHTGALQGTFKG